MNKIKSSENKHFSIFPFLARKTKTGKKFKKIPAGKKWILGRINTLALNPVTYVPSKIKRVLLKIA